MQILVQHSPQPTPIAGIAHATWAGSDTGLTQLSVWRQRLEPGAATPPHQHGCDEVVLCLNGWGEVHSQGQVQRFGPESVVPLPRDQVHQLFNAGPMPLELIGIFAGTPVDTRTPEGQALELPWRS